MNIMQLNSKQYIQRNVKFKIGGLGKGHESPLLRSHCIHFAFALSKKIKRFDITSADLI